MSPRPPRMSRHGRNHIMSDNAAVADVQELITKVQSYNPNAELGLIERAYNFAARSHAGHRRASGSPYLSHPLGVSMILADLRMDSVTIGSGLLHDTVEDCDVTVAQLQQEFGEEVAVIVDGVTKLGRVEFSRQEERQAETFRKMLLAMAKDIRVILVKLGDRLHNMRTLDTYRSISSSASPRRRWTSTRRWRTAWASIGSSPSLKTSRSSI